LKILKQAKEGNRVSLEIEIDYSQFLDQFNKVIKDASYKIKIPGFRPGKAPESILRQHINIDYAKQKALDDIVQILYPDIIKESKIEPVDYPFWKIISEKEGEKVVFLFEVDVMPEVELGKYKGLKGKRQSYSVEEKEVTDYIKAVQEEGSVLKEVNRPAKNGDVVELDVAGFVDGSQKEQLSQNRLPILLGDDRIAPGFDAHIENLNIGDEVEFSLTLPKDYFIKDFAGKNVLFKVKLNKVVERNLPEFNDEYVKRISSFENVEDYKKDVKNRIEEFKKRRSDDELKDNLLEQIISNSKVEIPNALIKRETDIMINELEESLSKQALSIDSYLKSRRMTLEDLKKELVSQAQTRIKAKLVLRAIAEKENIEFTEDDFSTEVKKLAKDLNVSDAEIIAKEGIREYIKDFVLRRKALDFVVENAKLTEKE